jgi:hypothetical protein
MITKITYKLTDLWIKSFTQIKVIGPIQVGSDDYRRVIAFRTLQNQLRAPYLEEKHQVDIETRLQIDERSEHYALQLNGVIAACVRMTPMPFEFSALSEEFAARSLNFMGYYEFGRLCTDINLERKGFHAGILVIKAAQKLFEMNEHAKGMVGICKTNRVAYMEKLGLKIDPRIVKLSIRQSEYHILHARREEFFDRYFFAQPKFVKSKSLENTHESRPSEKPSRSGIRQTG